MKIMKVILRILQGILLAFLLLAGVGSMPSIMGMMFLMLAIFVTPRKMLDAFLGDWMLRILCVAALLFYWGYLPMDDASIAGKNMGHFVLRIWQGISALWS